MHEANDDGDDDKLIFIEPWGRGFNGGNGHRGHPFCMSE